MKPWKIGVLVVAVLALGFLAVYLLSGDGKPRVNTNATFVHLLTGEVRKVDVQAERLTNPSFMRDADGQWLFLRVFDDDGDGVYEVSVAERPLVRDRIEESNLNEADLAIDLRTWTVKSGGV